MDIVKSISDAIGLPLETVNKAMNFLGELVGPTLREASLIPFDSLRELRYKRQVQILLRTREYCELNGINPNAIGMKNLVTLVETATIEDNNDLFEIWNNLLINSVVSSNGDEILLSSHIAILKQLSHIEVKLLEFAYSNREVNLHNDSTYDYLGLNMFNDVDKLKKAFVNLQRLKLTYDISEDFTESIESQLKSIGRELSKYESYDEPYSSSNSSGLTLAVLSKKLTDLETMRKYEAYCLTEYGTYFVEACRNPSKGR